MPASLPTLSFLYFPLPPRNSAQPRTLFVHTLARRQRPPRKRTNVIVACVA
jgi:hypothetical protein